MSALSMPSISRVYYRVDLSVDEVDADLLKTLPVEFAFLAVSEDDEEAPEPVDGDWIDGEWDPDIDTPTARILIGEGSGVPLENGTYHIWARVTGAIVQPAQRTDILKIT